MNKLYIRTSIATIAALYSCNAQGDQTSTLKSDTSVVDSARVVYPKVIDSGAVVNTPGVNDSNVIHTDTTGKK